MAVPGRGEGTRQFHRVTPSPGFLQMLHLKELAFP